MLEMELAIRRTRYRLNRQGMLELEAWLSPLLQADFSDRQLREATAWLLDCEAPELQAMMSGARELPRALRAVLR